MLVSKTELGIQVMKDRSVSLSAQQRSALILCDGKRSADDVVRMTAGVGVTVQDIEALAALGLVSLSQTPVASKTSEPSKLSAATGSVPLAVAMPAAGAVDNGIDFGAALNAAITLCSSLGFKGFGLNMALTGVDSINTLQKLAPEIRKSAGDAKYKSLHPLIFGKPL